MGNHLYRLEIGVVLKFTPVVRPYIFAVYLILYFEILHKKLLLSVFEVAAY